MQKSKLGLSIKLFSAILYFLVATGNILVILIASAYVLFFEENDKLKITAIKTIILGIFFEILILLMFNLTGLLAYTINILNSLNVISSAPANFSYILYTFVQTIVGSLHNITRIIITIFSIIFGFQAYREKNIKIKWIDSILDKNT